MDLFKLFGTIAIENSQANSDIDGTIGKAKKAETEISRAFKKIGAAVATYFAADKIISFGKEVVNVTAEVAAEASAFEQIMGDYSSEAAAKVGTIAEATGMVESRLTPYMTSMTAKFKGLGYDIDEATDLASTGLNIAADAAAFWDKSIDDSMSALNSFVNGNYEGGESIGLFANETTLAAWASENLGLKWSDLTEKEKQFSRLEFAKAMQEASGAAGQAAKESDQYANVQANLNEKWRQFKAQIGEPLLQSIVLPAMETLSVCVDKLGAGYQKLTAWIEDNQTLVTILAVATGALTAAIIANSAARSIQAVGIAAAKTAEGAAAIMTGMSTTVLGLHTVATGAATAATTAFGAAMAFITSPITLVILAIGALVAAGVLLYKNWDEISSWATKIWENIKSSIVNKVTEIKENVTAKFESLKETIKNVLGEGLYNAFTNIFSQIGGWVEQNIYQPIRDKVQGIFEIGGELVSWLWNGIVSVATSLFPGLKNILGDATSEAVATAGASMQGAVTEAQNAAQSAAQAAANTVISSASLVPVDAETPVSAMANVMENDMSMEEAGIEAVDRAGSSMQSAVATAGFDSAGQTAMQRFIQGINSMQGAVMAAVNAIASAAASRVQQALSSIQAMAASAGGSVGGYATGLDYVPYDEFPALLHKGEAVLTASEAAAWRAGKKEGASSNPVESNKKADSYSGITIVQNIQSVPQTPVEFASTTAAYFEQARWAMA